MGEILTMSQKERERLKLIELNTVVFKCKVIKG